MDVKQQHNNNHNQCIYCPHWMLFHSSTKAFFKICEGVWGILTLPYSSDCPRNALWGTNLDFMVASSVGRCFCLPENPDNLWLNVVSHCPAVKSADVAAREGLQRGVGSYPCTLLLLIAIYNNQLCSYPVRHTSPNHNGAAPNLFQPPPRQRKRRRSVDHSGEKRVKRDSSVKRTRPGC